MSLWSTLLRAGDLWSRRIFTTDGNRTLGELLVGSALFCHGDELYGRSVLIATRSQLAAALALIELDGVARRIILYPPDMPLGYLPYVVSVAEVDAIVSDGRVTELANPHVECFVPCNGTITPGVVQRKAQHETEWVLLTSGTTGLPKLVVHTLRSLTGAFRPSGAPAAQVVWSTFYDIRRYGGLQIFLRAVLSGKSLVLSDAQEPVAAFMQRAALHGVTHISGTPSHWRRALMSPASQKLRPEYVRLSGEIADQGILNHVQLAYPNARVAHAFATTEAGVAFDVSDGMSGFPASILESTPDVEMKIEDHSLRIRSDRTASRYLGADTPLLIGVDGFVDTGDLVELVSGRYVFVGRRDGVINVGGDKVYPEEVEAVINRHPAVQMSLVQKKRSPVTGALIVADVVLRQFSETESGDARSLQQDIMLLCRDALSPYKVPAAINFVPALKVAESGKLVRRDA